MASQTAVKRANCVFEPSSNFAEEQSHSTAKQDVGPGAVAHSFATAPRINIPLSKEILDLLFRRNIRRSDVQNSSPRNTTNDDEARSAASQQNIFASASFSHQHAIRKDVLNVSSNVLGGSKVFRVLGLEAVIVGSYTPVAKLELLSFCGWHRHNPCL